MLDKIKVASLQPKLFGHQENSYDKNLENAITMIREAARNGADVACLPELFMGGSVIESIPGRTTNTLCDVSKECGIHVIGHLWERVNSGRLNMTALPSFREGDIYSSSFFIDPHGEIIGVFRKAHLFPWEPKLFNCTPGDELPVFETGFGVAGILICHDLMIPEAARTLTLKGAEVIFVPTRMPVPFQFPWKNVMRVRALDNQVYMVSAGAADSEACGSIIVAPRFRDDVLSEADPKEQTIIYAELDLSWLREKRKGSPLYSITVSDFRSHKYEAEIETHCFLKDRRPELYK
jgi:omega-amidase